MTPRKWPRKQGVVHTVQRLVEHQRQDDIHDVTAVPDSGDALTWNSITWDPAAASSGPRDEAKWAIEGTGPRSRMLLAGGVNVQAFTGTSLTLGTITVDLTPYVDTGNRFSTAVPVIVEDVVPVPRRYIPGIVSFDNDYPAATEFVLSLFVDLSDLPNGGNFWFDGFIRLEGKS